MAYTLLQLVDQAAGEIGINQPTSVIGSSDPQILQLLALSNRLLQDLVRDYEWNRLVRAYVFRTTAGVTTTGVFSPNSAVITGIPDTSSLSADMVVSAGPVAPYTQLVSVDSGTQVTMNLAATVTSTTTATCSFALQDYALPSDFDRMVSDTNWDRTNHWRNLGPKSSQEWQWLQGGVISTGPRERFRIYQNKLRIFQALTTQIDIAYEYVSNYSVIATGGTAPTKSSFTVDTDTCVFKDDVMVLGLKYQWYKTKGLEYNVALAEFSRAVSYAKAQDEPVGAMSLAPVFMTDLVGPWSIQDGNWPTNAVN